MDKRLTGWDDLSIYADPYGVPKVVGFSHERLSYYVITGRFSRVQRGIYRLGQFPASPYEDLFVAWLRTGPEAVISHESAHMLFWEAPAETGSAIVEFLRRH